MSYVGYLSACPVKQTTVCIQPDNFKYLEDIYQNM